MNAIAPLSLTTWFSAWSLEPVGTVIAIAVAVGYALALAGARRRGHPWPALYPWFFAAGVVVLVISVDSAIGTYSHAMFWVHMIQHLLLITVVPALLVLGHPIGLLAASGPLGERVVGWVARNRLTGVITNPVVTLAMYTAVLVGTHLTGYMQAMTQHMWLHSLEVVLYLGSGYLFLLPLLVHEPIKWNAPYPARLGLLFVSMVVDAGVGIALMMAETDIFPGFAAMRHGWGPSGIADVHTGGAVMWVAGDGLMMLAIILLAGRWITDTERQNDMGTILESIRRNTIAGFDTEFDVPIGDGNDGRAADADAIRHSVNVDDDERAFRAYNRMLARLAEAERRADPPA